MNLSSATYILGFGILASLSNVSAQSEESVSVANSHRFQVSSTAFADGGTLPLSMVWDQCSDYLGGGNLSPELSWTHAPKKTRSFIVIGYDLTAQFTHWGMYNISAQATGLPQNAGVAGSVYGIQVLNDFFIDASYDGPCPPKANNPVTHQYVFTVYALDTILPQIPTFGDFAPAGPEGLYQALIAAALGEHVLDSASISGFFGN